ncbi:MULTISPECIES: multiprotein-bridging factor 1 family protein [unclassified Methylobacterium]|uniref:helix-turn-helix domain-containing protein n=1 Tax=unclassified Methylobacterium TaxID=2615210 RepID=UPI0036F97C08
MKPQIIRTEAGEELVVLTRREYDALLASIDAEEAEDCGTARLTDAYLVDEAAGRIAAIPHWFVKLVIAHGSPVAAARAYRGWTEAELAQATGLDGDLIARFERAEAEPNDGERQRLAEQTGAEPGWLR